ncbi:MAG: hypothetical protein R8K46_03095 [Mariprofundaceae bacterium]
MAYADVHLVERVVILQAEDFELCGTGLWASSLEAGMTAQLAVVIFIISLKSMPYTLYVLPTAFFWDEMAILVRSPF